jgi:hypothetical protein
MSENQTQPKPESAEQPSGKGLSSSVLLGDLVRIAGEAAINEDARTVRLCRSINYLVRQVRMIAGEADEEYIKERLDGIVPPALKMILPPNDEVARESGEKRS